MFLLLYIVFTFHLFAQDQSLDTIEVTHQGRASTLVDFIPSAVSLKQKELRKRREITLGETLRNEAGVQSSSFGPNASRPVIRGLDGDRIRLLQNGLGVLDASSQSVDHAVPVDTLVIDSLEVVRGPMSMLYGSSAVGGVININTSRIHSHFEKGSVQEIQVQGDSSQDALSSSAKIDYGVNDWMFHFDGGYRNANDLKIPGNQKSDHLVAPGEFEGKNKLPNSGNVQKSGALGISKVFSRGHLGLSYYMFDNFYGAVAEENVDIKMKQDRIELHGEYKLEDQTFKSIKLKTAQSDYGHKELESGTVGTTFTNEGNESRLELMSESDNLKGITGIQTQMFNFSAKGDEAYLPASNNRSVSAFTIQERKFDENAVTFGGRFENATIANQSSLGVSKSFNGVNSALGFTHKFSETHSGALNVSYTERIPNFQELFADGFHIAAGTFELGNENLKKEKAYAVDFSLKYNSDVIQTSFNIYAQQFKDYISLFLTDEASTIPGISKSRFQQVDAIFYGAEFDGKKRIGATPFHLLTRADFVRAKNQENGQDLPRISPPRITLGLEWVKDRLSWDFEGQYNFEQTHTADQEKRTDRFLLLNSGVFYDFIADHGKWSFFARLKNILNQEARLHTSTLKDIAPLAGRNVILGVQHTF
jgi:iron complex outermembrane receptor protein